MVFFLILIGGLCWTWAYIEIIRKGIKDRSYGMPLFALGLNLSWELLYTFLKVYHREIDAQFWVMILWLLFDFGIVYCYFRYGYKYFPKNRSKTEFYLWSLLVFASCFLLEYFFWVEFGNELGPRYSAFLQNLLMSVLFVDMFFKRRPMEGQSMVVAVNKWIGTLANTLLFGYIERSWFILIIGLLCFLFDLVYIYLIYSYKNSTLPEQMQSGGLSVPAQVAKQHGD